jgi:PEP-CTERM motif-containing protein
MLNFKRTNRRHSMARMRTWLVKETIVLTAIVVVVGAIVSGLGSGSALAVASICDAIAGNLVKNCGFETQPDFTDWTTIPAASGSDFGVDNSGNQAHSGDSAAVFAALGALDDTITQSLATTLGSQYTVNFWLAHPHTDNANDFKALWNAIPLLTRVNATSFAYTEFTFTVLGTGTDLLTFAGRENSEGAAAFYTLDDVSVTPAVPEPATLLLLGSGLAGLAAWRRRQAA